jgi:two-component system, chemotaxis family, chemotaxis protein CheY
MPVSRDTLFDSSHPVLVVEDSAATLRVVLKMLRHIGLSRVDAASNGFAALDAVRKKNYQLIISDWHLGRISGYELLQMVRADRETASKPFVIMTADPDVRNVLAAKIAGASDYLLKPFGPELLRTRLAQILNRNGGPLVCPDRKTFAPAQVGSAAH